MFVSLHFSVLSLYRMNQLKQTKLTIVVGNLYVHVAELYSLLHRGEAHWSHCVKRGVFTAWSLHCSTDTKSIRCKCKFMFWLENWMCCCSIASPLRHMSHSPETQFQGNPGLVICSTWALMSPSLSFALWVLLSPTATVSWNTNNNNNGKNINNCYNVSLYSSIKQQLAAYCLSSQQFIVKFVCLKQQ